MAVEKVNQSCFHGPVKVSIYHISQTNSWVCMKRFVIDNLYIVQVTSRLPLSSILTLRLLMSYIYGAPSKARNANFVYIWTYFWQR